MFLSIVVAASATPARAQEGTASEGFASGGFGAPVVKFSSLVDEFAMFAGARGGWVANHRFVVGAGVYALTNTIDAEQLIEPITKLIYAGLELEYIGLHSKPAHFSFLVLIGAGRRWRTDEPDPDHDEIWVIEPALSLELAPTTFLRIDAGAGYRFVGRVTTNDTDNSDFSAFFGALTFKLGSF